jgi:hypothetical protein
MITFIAIWLSLGVGMEIGHQMEAPSSNVVKVAGRVVAWPAAAVEKRIEVEDKWKSEPVKTMDI